MTDTPIADTILGDTNQILSDAERTDDRGEFIRRYPTTLRPAVDEEFVGTFKRIDRGPDGEYGRPYIAVFDLDKGVQHDGTVLEPGTEVGLWLIHSVALNGLKELRPEPGERVAGVYLGTRVTKATAGLPEKQQRTYHVYRFACPDRAEAQPVTSWDAITDAPADEPDF